MIARTIQLSLFIITMGMIILVSPSCHDGIPKGPDPKPTLSTIKSPVAITFLDAASSAGANVKNVKVTLIDPSGQVRTASGQQFTSLTAGFGVISLGLLQNAVANEELPYQFSIKAEADGYIENFRTITITGEKAGYLPIYLASIENPPPGLRTAAQTIAVNSSGMVNSDIAIQASDQTGNGIFSLRIPAGTQFLQDGEPIENFEGDAKLQLSNGDPASIYANRVFPGGPLVSNAVDSLGQVIATTNDPFYFRSGGWTSIDIKLGDAVVNGFSQPLTVSMPINPDLINPETNEPFQIGDLAPIWSFDDKTGRWTQESSVSVNSSVGQLVFNFPITHLSTWNVDYKGPKCGSDLIIPYANSGCPGVYYSQLTYSGITDDFPLTSRGETQSHSLTYNNGGGQFTIMNAPADIPNLVFEVYDNPTAASGTSVTANITSCSTAGVDVSSFDASASCDYFIMEFNVAGTSDDVCNVAVWYREESVTPDTDIDPTNPWKHAGTVGPTSGILSTALFNPGTDYRILLWWGWNLVSSTDPEPILDDHSLRFTLPSRFISFSPTSATECTASQALSSEAVPNIGSVTVTINAKCYEDGSSTCSAVVPEATVNCNSFGAAGDTKRGVFINIEETGPSSIIPVCS